MVTDAHDHEPIDWTVTGILAKSSNVGTIMLAREVGDEKLEQYLRAFGIGSETGIELPGESAGILQDSDGLEPDPGRQHRDRPGRLGDHAADGLGLPDHRQRRGARRAAHRPLGHLARTGRCARPTSRSRTRVVSEATADSLAYMLEAVVGPGGTAPLGQIEGFRVAGKTGTAQRANPETGTYDGGGYVTTFVGFAPADDPQYVVAVDLERPTSSAEGGQVAAPVFADILRYALTADGVVPSGTPRPDFQLTGTP